MVIIDTLFLFDYTIMRIFVFFISNIMFFFFFVFVFFFFFFFFQAEDGIRDKLVTGVQTCALPIFGVGALLGLHRQGDLLVDQGGLDRLLLVDLLRLDLLLLLDLGRDLHL